MFLHRVSAYLFCSFKKEIILKCLQQNSWHLNCQVLKMAVYLKQYLIRFGERWANKDHWLFKPDVSGNVINFPVLEMFYEELLLSLFW